MRIRDEKTKIIMTSKANSISQLHNQVVAFLVAILHELGIEVNYDHITSTVPICDDIPLIYKDEHGIRRADIAFMIDENTIALIDVKTRRLNTQFYRKYLKKLEGEKGNGKSKRK